MAKKQTNARSEALRVALEGATGRKKRPSDYLDDPANLVAYSLKNPRLALLALDKFDAESSMEHFVKLLWSVTDPAQPLVWGWTMSVIAEHLEAVHRGQITNILFNVPPGFSKSSMTNVFLPAYEWGPKARPDLRYLAWSYSHDLTKRDNIKSRAIILSPLYQALWGDRFELSDDQNTKERFNNNHGGTRIASSILGLGTGERGDRLIIDDPHSVLGAESEADRTKTIDWFAGTLPSRVRNAGRSATVVVMQRLGLGDVSGVILEHLPEYVHVMIEMEYEGASHPARKKTTVDLGNGMVVTRPNPLKYEDPREKLVAMVPASKTPADLLDPEDNWWTDFFNLWIAISKDMATLADPIRFPRHEVEKLKHQMLLKSGTNAVAAQLRQWPYEGTGIKFRREWFTMIDPDQVPNGIKGDVRGWDLASSKSPAAAQTASVKMRLGVDKRIYILHCHAIRGGPADVDKFIKSMAALDGKKVEQNFPKDPGQAGAHQIAYFARELLQGHTVRSSPESGSKVDRANPLSGQAQLGNVVIVRGPWNEDLLRELVDFPVGLFCDRVDAATRAYDALVNTNNIGGTYGGELFDANGRAIE